MKKNINKLGLVSFLSLIVLMTSCTKDENTSETPTLGLADTEGYLITNGKLSLQGAATSTIMNVISNVDWNITDDADWLDFTPTEGNGNAEVTMTVDENTTPDARTATLTLNNSSGRIAEPVTITVTQISNVTPTLMLDSDKLPINSTAGEHEVKVIANVAWDCEVAGDNISGGDDDWLKVKEKGADKLIFSVTENTADDTRNAYIKFFNEEYQLLYTLTVSQLPELEVTTDDGNIGFESQDITINVVSSSTWSYNITGDNTEWLTEKSKSDNQLILTATKFSSYSTPSRTATVTISDGSDSKSVTIMQSSIVAAELLDVVFNMDKTANDISVLGNNIYTVNMTGNEDYLNVVYDEDLGFNVAQFTNPTTNVVGSSAFAMSYKDNTSFISAMDNGFSIELLAKPHWYGTKPSSYAITAMNSQSGGGIAIKCSNSRGWYFEPGVGSTNYLQVYEDSPIREDEWSHIVAIYGTDKSISIYVNGEFKNTKSNSDALRHGSAYEIVIGGRTGGSDCFGGEIGIFRMYDRVLTADEISGLYEDATSN